MIKTSVATVAGINTITGNLRKRQAGLGTGLQRGLKMAGDYLLRESQKLVPVEYGNMKASGFSKLTGRSFDSKVTVGYSDPNALVVHENVEMVLRGQPRPSGIATYWHPGQAKFLEEPARRLKDEMRAIIRASMVIR